MNRETLLARRDRTHAVVEGALLGDIAIVFLLMRAFLPLPGVRQLLRAVATVPFVMLTQRRGLRLAILAAIASYVLFSALVGPILALAAVDVAVAGLLAGAGRRLGLGLTLNVFFTGPIYAVLDLILPTIASVYIFRYPIKDLSDGARNFVKVAFNFLFWVMNIFHPPHSAIHSLNLAKAWCSDHWVVPWVILLVVYGLITMYLAILITEAVLKQLPGRTLARQRAA